MFEVDGTKYQRTLFVSFKEKDMKGDFNNIFGDTFVISVSFIEISDESIII